MFMRTAIGVTAAIIVSGCTTDQKAYFDTPTGRVENRFTNYPIVGKTYLSYSPGHGFQISYYETDSRSWLWYPGNKTALPEDWKIEGDKICYRHPRNTYNPETKKFGGSYDCMSRSLLQTSIVEELDGDIYSLSSGQVPYARDKCDAPPEFEFEPKKAVMWFSGCK